MDEELVAYLDRRFDEARQHGDRQAEETRLYVDRQGEETRRHFDVVAEGLRGDLRVIAEGHLSLGRQIQEMREENEAAHRETRAAIKLSYSELDRRISRLESVTTDLQVRLERLEAVR